MELIEQKFNSLDVGKILRIMREERDISMRSLARDSGLSANALSMIERGLTSPSVSTLNKIATALGVPITAFFRTEPSKQKIVYRKSTERRHVPFKLGLGEGLGGEEFNGHLEAFYLNLEKGANSGTHKLLHTGHEFVYCISGILDYEVDGQHFILKPGDSLIFGAKLPHRWRNENDADTKVIIVIAGFEDSERPSEFHLAASMKDINPS